MAIEGEGPLTISRPSHAIGVRRNHHQIARQKITLPSAITRRNEVDNLAIEGAGPVTVSRLVENPSSPLRRTPRLTANTTVSYRV